METDLCNGEFCGNTIICALNTPIKILGNENVGNTIMGMSVIAGKLAAYLGCIGYSPYNYRDSLIVSYKDYHFFKNCPLKLRTSLGLELFSILCVINYAIVFVEQFFIDEIPQKKFQVIKPTQINILFAGRFEYQKGVDQMIAVVSALKDDSRFYFHVVGSGSMEPKVITAFKGLTNVTVYSD